MTLVRLATAYCPDVPSSRESRGCKVHGVAIEPETRSSLGTTFCGLLCNHAELFPPDLIRDRICKRCLRFPRFRDDINRQLEASVK